MLRVNSISNVNNTLKNISFKAGVQTNYGVQEKTGNLVDQGILTGFVGVLKIHPFSISAKLTQELKVLKTA